MNALQPYQFRTSLESLITLTHKALEQHAPLEQVADLRDDLVTFQAIAHRIKADTLFQNALAAEIIQLSRYEGRILASIEREPGTRSSGLTGFEEALQSVGISRQTASAWGWLARIDDNTFASEIETRKSNELIPLTLGAMVWYAKALEHGLPNPALPGRACPNCGKQLVCKFCGERIK